MKQEQIFNRKIHLKIINEDREKFFKKLKRTKTYLDMDCPESFTFYKNGFHKENYGSNKFIKKFVTYNNNILNNHVKEIRFRKLEFPKPFLFENNNQPKNGDLIYTKKQQLRINKENQIYRKTLSTKKSLYNRFTWEKDFQASRSYKKNKCMYPSIDFNPHKNKMGRSISLIMDNYS